MLNASVTYYAQNYAGIIGWSLLIMIMKLIQCILNKSILYCLLMLIKATSTTFHIKMLSDAILEHKFKALKFLCVNANAC